MVFINSATKYSNRQFEYPRLAPACCTSQDKNSDESLLAVFFFVCWPTATALTPPRCLHIIYNTHVILLPLRSRAGNRYRRYSNDVRRRHRPI